MNNDVDELMRLPKKVDIKDPNLFEALDLFIRYLTLELGRESYTTYFYSHRITTFLNKNPKYKKPSDLKDDSFDEYYKDLVKEGKKDNSILANMTALKSWTKYMAQMGWLKGIISCHCLPPIPAFNPKTFSGEQVRFIIDSYDRIDFIGMRNKCILELIWGTGLRRAELYNLNVRDINFSRGYLKVHGKGNRERLVPIPKYTLEVLKEYVYVYRHRLKIKEPEAVFLSVKTAKRLARKSYINIPVHVLKHGATNYHFSLHSFRHAYATALLDLGTPIEIVGRLLGHQSLRTTERYTQTTNINLVEEYKKYMPERFLKEKIDSSNIKEIKENELVDDKYAKYMEDDLDDLEEVEEELEVSKGKFKEE